MFKGYRTMTVDGDLIVWKFYRGEKPIGSGKEDPHEEFKIGPFKDGPSYRESRAEIDGLADACWQQGRASAHDEHANESQEIAGLRKQITDQHHQIMGLQDRIEAISRLATRAWLESRYVAADELRDAMKDAS